MSDPPAARRSRAVLWPRLAIGFAQGMLLWLLFDQAVAVAPHVYTPLFAIALLVPVVALAGVGSLPAIVLALWLSGAAVLIAVVEAHQSWRNPIPGIGLAAFESSDTIAATLALAGALFIAHILVVAGAADRRPIAAYATYFDAAWKHQLQLLFSLGFVGAF